MRTTEPTQLGEFTILEKIGQGAMGAVYKARQSSLGRVVALKLLPAHYAGDADFVARFKREASAAAGLNHPNIVQIYAAGQDGGAHYFAMEYVDGESLGARLGRKGRIDPREALAVAHYVAQALDYAWKKAGIVHRDIKPDNIFLSRESTVKLGDLGLAKVLAGDGAGLTQTGMTMGTPYYVSPEQAIGNKEIDFRADIYSLGCTLFHAISGQTPYRGESAMSVMLQHITQQPPKIQTAWPECPPSLVNLLDCMLRKKPEERQENYEVLLQQLTWVAERLDAPSASQAAAMSMIVPMPGERPASEPAAPVAKSPPSKLSKASGRPWKIAVALAGLAGVAAGVTFWQPWKKPVPIPAPPVDAMDTPAPATPLAARSATPEPVKSVASISGMAAALVASPAGASFAAATKEAPLVNSLGMRFVPVPITGGPTGGQRVLFSVWETRVQDYAVFAQEANYRWGKPAIEPEFTYPAVGVNWDGARAFCLWLTEHERKAGRLGSNEAYRLPSDHEWSCAVGIGDLEDAAKTPEEKNGKIRDVYPWGTQWPPPAGAGNYAGEEMKPALAAGKYSHIGHPIAGYNDGYVETAPVGSFRPNQYGIYDMGGNAWEWCEDWYDEKHEDKTMRDSPWDKTVALFSSIRTNRTPGTSSPRSGFRCVLAAVELDMKSPAPLASIPEKSPATPVPAPPPALTAASAAPNTPAPTPAPTATPPMTDAEGFISLLDGDHIDGWKQLGTGGFTFENGAWTSWVARQGQGCWWYSRERFTDFTLKVEFRIGTPGGNSGIYVRSPYPRDDLRVPISQSYQIDISESRNPTEMTGAICLIKAPTSVPQKARDWNELEINAVGQHYLVKVNGTLVNDFTGNKATSGYIGLQNFSVGGVQFRKIRIKDNSATPVAAATPAPVTAPVPSSSLDLNSPARWKNAINLLAAVDLPTDTVAGALTPGAEGLVSTGTGLCKLELPYRPPAEYDFRMTFTCWSGVGELNQMLSRGGRSFEWCIGANGTIFGFQSILGQNASINPTVNHIRLEKNRKYTSLVAIRNDGMKGYLDGALVSQWKTNYSDMGVWAHWKLPDDTRLGVGTLNTSATIHAIEVLDVTGQGQLLRPAKPVPGVTASPVSSPPAPSSPGPVDREGFTSLFNGRDLTGWDGDRRFWSVQNDAITGETKSSGMFPANTFLVWKGGQPRDFELRYSFKILAGNSGVQYRSRLVDAGAWRVLGYQYEIEAVKTGTNGALYEEGGHRQGLGGTFMANLGEKVRMAADDHKQLLGNISTPFKYHIDNWNDAVIVAQGAHLTHQLNGDVCIEVEDEDEKARAVAGVLALQLHAGPPQKVQFKDIRLKTLPAP